MKLREFAGQLEYFSSMAGAPVVSALSVSVSYPAAGETCLSLHSSQADAIASSATGEAGFGHGSMPNEKGLA